jgi:hypothetical protein
MAADKVKTKRGFANVPADEMKAIASAAGKEAHRLGRAHTFTSEEARAANLKGQAAKKAKKLAAAAREIYPLIPKN